MVRMRRPGMIVGYLMLLAALPLLGAGDQPTGAPQAGTGVIRQLSTAPPGAVILFDGKDLSQWRRTDGQPATWKIENGAMVAQGGNVVSTETFQDIFLHLEFKTPHMPQATGQGRGNSGVYLQARYEVQVLDSYGIAIPGKGDCGAIYGQYAPLVNACRPPLYWQSYDIVFRTPRFDSAGKELEPGRMTVLQNGVVIQNNAQLLGATVGRQPGGLAGPGPLLLQDHGNPVQYRNIWLVHLPPQGSDTYGPR